MIYKPILSGERLPILVLIVSGILTVSHCQEDILQDIVTNVSIRASLFARSTTDCSEFISLSNYNSTCESEVPYDNVTDLSVVVHFDWNPYLPLEARCYCSAALLSLLIPEPITSVLTSYPCADNENATIYCSKPCIHELQNEVSCDDNENCKDLACFMYGKMPYILSNQRQLYILVTGINCDTIGGHALDLCRAVLFASSSSTIEPTPTATKTFTEEDIGAVFIFSIIFVGIFLTCICTIAAVLIGTCFLRRRENAISQKSKSVNFDIGSHNRVTMILQENNMPVNSQPSSMESLIEYLVPASQIEVLEVTGQGQLYR
ncbi:PREDICTED: uncharacterized protein LOC109586752 [Amphimedon queenslandica]|uniref:FZ domain-containing protein n=1 Tax=Amphimedon queenslandica TaxID=400682 RepID=A0AAN0JNB8_AMPQE|nr:PREDICTED: uncharacterized protein LOC109586752 [Amphimedon queenslandica]|eukprot:XP_019858521.1 PREDICTED: uncharacterized protein LOC109586752 [Amphimedon queenslandica]